MTDTNNSGDKSLGSAKPTLHLKRPVDSGTVRQSFSHGRSKVVVVEKKRSVLGREGGAGTISLSPKPAAAAPAAMAEAKTRRFIMAGILRIHVFAAILAVAFN